MTPEDIAAEIEYAQAHWAIFKDAELQALVRGDMIDEVKLSQVREAYFVLIQCLKAVESK